MIQLGWDLKINQSVTNIQNKLQELIKKLVKALYFEGRFLSHIGISKSSLQINDCCVLRWFGGDRDVFWETTHFSASSWGVGGVPDSSVGKEFICNAGDSGSVPGLGRSPGEGIGYPLQYSCLEDTVDYGYCRHKDGRT